MFWYFFITLYCVPFLASNILFYLCKDFISWGKEESYEVVSLPFGLLMLWAGINLIAVFWLLFIFLSNKYKKESEYRYLIK